jgi:predicted HAD superfamily Cof-like phosphohydrolase
MSKTDDIREFHRAMDVLVQDTPGVPPSDVKELRISLITEEFKETIEALERDDLVETADGLVDLVVVVIGTALSYGIPFDAVWDEIHRSNMAKRDPETGKVIKRADGKVLKPDGWTPPNVARTLSTKRRYP